MIAGNCKRLEFNCNRERGESTEKVTSEAGWHGSEDRKPVPKTILPPLEFCAILAAAMLKSCEFLIESALSARLAALAWPELTPLWRARRECSAWRPRSFDVIWAFSSRKQRE